LLFSRWQRRKKETSTSEGSFLGGRGGNFSEGERGRKIHLRPERSVGGREKGKAESSLRLEGVARGSKCRAGTRGGEELFSRERGEGEKKKKRQSPEHPFRAVGKGYDSVGGQEKGGRCGVSFLGERGK